VTFAVPHLSDDRVALAAASVSEGLWAIACTWPSAVSLVSLPAVMASGFEQRLMVAYGYSALRRRLDRLVLDGCAAPTSGVFSSSQVTSCREALPHVAYRIVLVAAPDDPRGTRNETTVLFLAANPVAMPLLQLGEECRAIEDKIRAAKFRERLRFRSRWAARPDDLLQALHEDDPAVLHFTGHGAGAQGLCFLAEDGGVLRVNSDGLGQVIRAAGDSIELVVLNACYTKVQAEALIAHVSCVIGMPSTIGDKSAIVYAAELYRALAFGKSVAIAHQCGLAALALALHSMADSMRDVDVAEAVLRTTPPELLVRTGVDAGHVHIVGGALSTSTVPASSGESRIHLEIDIDADFEKLDASTLSRLVSEGVAGRLLFGSRRSAFSGAIDAPGHFQLAHGGTLFLDEVDEAPPEVQDALLRVLETGEIHPVGAEEPVATDVRLIAATGANLNDQVQYGQFQAPLLHRLAGFEVRIPPLRERREDIGLLFYHFAREDLEALGESHRLSPQDPYARPCLPAHVAAQLVRHTWPGNIRELRNVTRQLVMESRGLPQQPERWPAGTKDLVLESVLEATLRTCAWDLRLAADRLGMSRRALTRRLRKLGLPDPIAPSKRTQE
jgi:hypothetical protein